MFSKRAGILVSKLGTETHGPDRGQKNKLSSVPTAGEKTMGHAPLLKPPGPWTSSFVSLSEPWVYITSTPAPVPVFQCHNKLSWVKWVRNADWWPRVPMFSKREGILVSKLSAETHGPAAGQQGKLHLIPAAGRETKALQLGRENNKICLSAMAERHIKKLQMIFLNK